MRHEERRHISAPGGGTRLLRAWGAALVPALGLGAAAAVVVGGTAPSGAAAPAPSSASAAALEATAMQDAVNSGWVHEVSHASAKGHLFSSDNDIGTFEGRQIIDTDQAQAEVVQIGQEAYIRGNATAISNFFGLTKNDPQQLANTWISVLPSDGGEYTTVIDAVTLKSDFQDESKSISGPLSEGHPVTVDGQRCLPITGHVASGTGATATATLYVTDSKRPLPVALKASNNTVVSTTTWSRWGQPATLTAPSDPVSFSSLFG